MYKYPYGDSQQLNLDWIISKIKELEDAGIGLDLEDVSKALISLPYNTISSYRRYDYAFLNGKLYRCLTDTTGAFDPAAWQEALIGDDLAVLTRWINAIDAAAVVDVKFDTSGTNGKLQQKYHEQYHDVVEVDYTPVQYSKRPLSSNAGYTLNGSIDAINNVVKWENGGIRGSDGQNADNSKRVRSTYLLPPFFNLTLPAGYYVLSRYLYDSNGNYITYTSYTSATGNHIEVNNLNNPNGYLNRVSISKDPEADITYQDIENNYSFETRNNPIWDLNGAINAITPLDTTPTSGSTKGITSGAVQSSLSAKQDTLSTVTGQVTSAGLLPLEGILLKKYGNVVFLYMASSGTPVAMTTDYTTIATLPIGFRPSSTIIKKDIIYTNGGHNQEACTTQILNNGAVQIACPGNNNYEFLRLYVTFIVD